MGDAKKRKAGKKSGQIRKARVLWRRFDVLLAYERLKPRYRVNPFSDESLKALEEECRNPTPECKMTNRPTPAYEVKNESPDPHVDELLDSLIEVMNPRPLSNEVMNAFFAAFKASPKEDFSPLNEVCRDTLKKDLIALGIRSRRRTKRSG